MKYLFITTTTTFPPPHSFCITIKERKNLKNVLENVLGLFGLLWCYQNKQIINIVQKNTSFMFCFKVCEK